MMKSMALLLMLASTLVMGREDSRCLGGGDGGVPLIQMPVSLAPYVSLVKTKHAMKDFLFWEKSNELLYSDAKGMVHQHRLGNGQEDILFSDHGRSLSRIIDGENRYFTGLPSPVLFDTKSKSNKNIPYSDEQVELFWNKGVLYTTPVRLEHGEPTNITAYDAATGKITSCTVDPSLKGLKVAKRNVFPYVRYYQQLMDSTGTLYFRSFVLDARPALNSGNCVMNLSQTYFEKIPGPIVEMYSYEHLGQAFKIEHPTKQLFWKGTECAYFDLSGHEVNVLDSDIPYAAVRSQTGELKILNLMKREKIEVKAIGKYKLSAKDFALTKDGKRLFISQQIEPNASHLRILFEMSLGGKE